MAELNEVVNLRLALRKTHEAIVRGTDQHVAMLIIVDLRGEMLPTTPTGWRHCPPSPRRHCPTSPLPHVYLVREGPNGDSLPHVYLVRKGPTEALSPPGVLGQEYCSGTFRTIPKYRSHAPRLR